jgi:hypothetical protein
MTTDLEERLRSALAARAGQISLSSLQPAVPPTALGRPRRGLVRLWASVGALAGTLAVAVTILVLQLPGEPSEPILPVTSVPAAPSPSATTPRPEPSETVLDPTPAPGATEEGAAVPTAPTTRIPSAESSRTRPPQSPSRSPGPAPTAVTTPLPTATG